MQSKEIEPVKTYMYAHTLWIMARSLWASLVTMVTVLVSMVLRSVLWTSPCSPQACAVWVLHTGAKRAAELGTRKGGEGLEKVPDCRVRSSWGALVTALGGRRVHCGGWWSVERSAPP